MHDLKYLELQKLFVDVRVEIMVRSLKSACLADVAKAFQRNTQRVSSLAEAPASMLLATKFVERVVRVLLDRQLGDTFEQTIKNIEDELKKELVYDRVLEMLGGKLTIDEERQASWSMIQSFMASESDIRIAFETILFSVLTGTWTAFESMAVDLWVAALNAHPGGLSELRGRRARKKAAAKARQAGEGTEILQASTETAEGAKIDVSLLRRHHYDLSGRMGTILKRRFEFSRLRGVRDAYTAAFDVDFEAVDASLSNRDLDALEAVRNVLVHRGGLVDDMFADRVKRIPGLSDFKEGDPLQVDGALVSSMVNSVVGSCIALIKAVDEWLVTNSEPVMRPLYEPS